MVLVLLLVCVPSMQAPLGASNRLFLFSKCIIGSLRHHREWTLI